MHWQKFIQRIFDGFLLILYTASIGISYKVKNWTDAQCIYPALSPTSSPPAHMRSPAVSLLFPVCLVQTVRWYGRASHHTGDFPFPSVCSLSTLPVPERSAAVSWQKTRCPGFLYYREIWLISRLSQTNTPVKTQCH